MYRKKSGETCSEAAVANLLALMDHCLVTAALQGEERLPLQLILIVFLCLLIFSSMNIYITNEVGDGREEV